MMSTFADLLSLSLLAWPVEFLSAGNQRTVCWRGGQQQTPTFNRNGIILKHGKKDEQQETPKSRTFSEFLRPPGGGGGGVKYRFS